MSGSSKSVRCNACVHRLDLGLYSHPKELGGEGGGGGGARSHVSSKGKLPSTGGSEEVGTRDTQDSEPNTLPTDLFRPSIRWCDGQDLDPRTFGTRGGHLGPQWLLRRWDRVNLSSKIGLSLNFLSGTNSQLSKNQTEYSLQFPSVHYLFVMPVPLGQAWKASSHFPRKVDKAKHFQLCRLCDTMRYKLCLGRPFN